MPDAVKENNKSSGSVPIVAERLIGMAPTFPITRNNSCSLVGEVRYTNINPMPIPSMEKHQTHLLHNYLLQNSKPLL